MMTIAPSRRNPAGRVLWVAALFVAGLALIPWFSGVSVGAPPVPPAAHAQTPVGFSATLTFNGLQTVGATSVANALSVSPGIVTASFSWQDLVPVGTSASVAQAQLLGYVFGFAAYNRVQVASNTSAAGSINLSGDFSQVRYVAEGVYELVGQLTATNGSTIWSETFYIHVLSTDHLTVVNIVLIAIFLWEVYAIAKLRSPPRLKKGGDSSMPPAKDPPAPVDSP